ncbi:MAG TPA: hypothetical protein VFX20_11005 [Steroidobacteraceae bacterium]|nr:hypothetical protein [Steroidobacteraceae bacterium]
MGRLDMSLGVPVVHLSIAQGPHRSHAISIAPAMATGKYIESSPTAT